MASKDEIADEGNLFPLFPGSFLRITLQWRAHADLSSALLQIAARRIHHNTVMPSRGRVGDWINRTHEDLTEQTPCECKCRNKRRVPRSGLRKLFPASA